MNIRIGIIPLTALVFTVLKLTHVIAWSWWWVLSPLWLLPVGIIVFFCGGIVLGLLALAFLKLVAKLKN